MYHTWFFDVFYLIDLVCAQLDLVCITLEFIKRGVLEFIKYTHLVC